MAALDVSDVDRSVLARSPLTSVICQIRFNSTPAAADAATARAVLEALAETSGDAPKMEQITETSINVAMAANAAPAIAQQPGTTGWRFLLEGGTRVVTLMPHAVALEATTYEGWDDDFAPRIGDVLAVIANLVSPVFEQRLGLRYINQVTEPDVRASEDWRRWLDERLLGLVAHDEIGPLVTFMRQQAVLQLDEEVRCTLNHGFAPDPDRNGALTYLLDFDVFREGVRPFDLDGIRGALDALNTYALRLFQLSTDVALRNEVS